MEVEKIGRYTSPLNSMQKALRLSVPGFNVIGRIEKSAERDSIGESDVSKASNVTGTPSI